VSGDSELFGDLPEQPVPEQLVPEAPGWGTPRLRQPERHQLGWQVAAIDDLVARDHPVRAVWAFVQGLDLRALHDAVKARVNDVRTWTLSAIENWTPGLSDSAPRFSRGGLSR
jgi:hypothetical protein